MDNIKILRVEEVINKKTGLITDYWIHFKEDDKPRTKWRLSEINYGAVNYADNMICVKLLNLYKRTIKLNDYLKTI